MKRYADKIIPVLQQHNMLSYEEENEIKHYLNTAEGDSHVWNIQEEN